MPAFRKFIVMPPPMVPAPMTPTLRIARSGVPSGSPGILRAARSAVNTWRRARASGVAISDTKASRSSLTPSSKGLVSDQPTASTHLSGAGYGPATAPTVLRANWSRGSPCGSFSVMSRSRCSGSLPATTRSASAIAAGTGSPSTTSSSSAVPFSLAAGTVAPDVIMFKAVSRPTARGSRCVPPAPGSRPSLTSGSAIWASARATR